MLIGFALIIVAVFLCCALLFRLSIYALPLFVAFLAGTATYRGGSGIVAVLVAPAIARCAIWRGQGLNGSYSWITLSASPSNSAEGTAA